MNTTRMSFARRTLMAAATALSVVGWVAPASACTTHASPPPHTTQTQHQTQPLITYSVYTTSNGVPAAPEYAPANVPFTDHVDFESDPGNADACSATTLQNATTKHPAVWLFTCTVPRDQAPDLSSPIGGDVAHR